MNTPDTPLPLPNPDGVLIAHRYIGFGRTEVAPGEPAYTAATVRRLLAEQRDETVAALRHSNATLRAEVAALMGALRVARLYVTGEALPTKREALAAIDGALEAARAAVGKTNG